MVRVESLFVEVTAWERTRLVCGSNKCNKEELHYHARTRAACAPRKKSANFAATASTHLAAQQTHAVDRGTKSIWRYALRLENSGSAIRALLKLDCASCAHVEWKTALRAARLTSASAAAYLSGHLLTLKQMLSIFYFMEEHQRGRVYADKLDSTIR
jgi:hypothetical protein